MNLVLGLTAPSVVWVAEPVTSLVQMEITSQSWRYVQAISIGAVFFGATTLHRQCAEFYGEINSRAIWSSVPKLLRLYS